TTPSTIGCDLIFTLLPLHTITGYIHAPTFAAANAVTLKVIDGSNTIECAKVIIPPILGIYLDTATYSCSISTTSPITGLTINATAASGYAVSPATYAVTGVVGVDFVASVVPIHTISGTINIGNNVSVTTVTAAVDTGAGTCTLTGSHAQNTNDSYTCTVPSGANHLSIAISPACSTGGGSKKYQMSDGTTTTSGTGSLVINFSNITGNISKNITITKSTTNC
ncbi:MAG: hypothetical protein LUQ26_09570, partial [Methylococcaceae bacterium]|nr:hypothetical protein [Methylococcaceae bacterium]